MSEHGFFRITILGEPRGQGRPRAFSRGGRASVYKNKVDRLAESHTRTQIIGELNQHNINQLVGELNQNNIPIPFVPSGPVELQIKAVHSAPKGRVRKTVGFCQILRDRKPDIDNIVKHVMDACNGVLWADDSQVCVLKAEQLDSAIPPGGPPEPGYLEILVIDRSEESGP